MVFVGSCTSELSHRADDLAYPLDPATVRSITAGTRSCR